MTGRQIIHTLYMRKWPIIIPMILAPLFAMYSLIFAEPQFESRAKVWIKNKPEDSYLLRIERGSDKTGLHAEVQREIFMSVTVLTEVVRQSDLIYPPPSQSIYSRLFGQPPPKPIDANSPEALTQAVNTLYGQVNVSIINSEIIGTSVRMNTPELAQKVSGNLLKAYKVKYGNILLNEITGYEAFLEDKIAESSREVSGYEKTLIEFEKNHPEALSKPLLTPDMTKARISQSILFADKMGEMSPIPAIIENLGKLEMARNRIAATAGPDSRELKLVNQQIQADRELLNRYQTDLAKQSELAVLHNRHQWDLNEARKRFAETQVEYNKILLSKGANSRQIGSIAVLDPPGFNPIKIYPQKTRTLIVAMFLGFMVGLSLAYTANLLDQTYYLPEDLEGDTGLEVLTSIPGPVAEALLSSSGDTHETD